MTAGRTKTYTAQSGYVYQYRLLQKARRDSGPQPGLEFVFEISSDRKTSTKLAVFVTDGGIAEWKVLRGRELADPEIHAAAKLRLWQALDEFAVAAEGRGELLVDASNICGLLDEIGVD